MKKCRYRRCLSLALTLLGFGLSSCASPQTDTLGQLAYDSGGEGTVYLEEGDRMVPYLVLTETDGAVLLLREYLLPQPQPISDYSSYYEDSPMDSYLNTTFLSTLAPETAQKLLHHSVTITAEESLGSCGENRVDIQRQVFLLSCTELGFQDLSIAVQEGTPLSYFADPAHRVAQTENGIPASWWLRTPDTGYLSCTFGIGPDGRIGSGNANASNGVRPAFWLPSNLSVSRSDQLIQGEEVFTLANDP